MNRHALTRASGVLLALLPLLAACRPDWVEDPAGPLRRLSVSPKGLRCAAGERQRLVVEVELTPGADAAGVTVSVTPDNANVAATPDLWQARGAMDTTAVVCHGAGSTTLEVAAQAGTRRLTAKVPVTITAAP